MKHIKPYFEGLDYDTKELEWEEFNSTYLDWENNTHRGIPNEEYMFEDSEKNQIKSIFVSHGIKPENASKTYISVGIRDKRQFSITLLIRKLPDEWYLVEIYTRNKEDYPTDKKYYKVDQLEGLIEFLNNYLKEYTQSQEKINKLKKENLIETITSKLKNLSLEELTKLNQSL
jgi:hypothetical protein